ncbi:hypothetical protein HCH_03114 [Hahella chejuensis KCTC 2396]|uniref:Uncharacterized protein n=1 Tax=Hahella chejuensis (strain KCTC 2396) TaxID=349521 RepID=Q2SHJ5_HAHCH|nr:hypothetical protein HCH_03114 [Hahella chejuensis KCTC 2396]
MGQVACRLQKVRVAVDVSRRGGEELLTREKRHEAPQ